MIGTCGNRASGDTARGSRLRVIHNRVNGENNAQNDNLIPFIGDVYLKCVAPGHPFFMENGNLFLTVNYRVIMGKEIAFNLPVRAVDYIFLF